MLYIFDLGNVIVDIDFNRVLGTWSDLTRIPLATLKQDFVMGDAFHQHECGEISDEEFAAAMCHEMNMPLSYEQFAHGRPFLSPCVQKSPTSCKNFATRGTAWSYSRTPTDYIPLSGQANIHKYVLPQIMCIFRKRWGCANPKRVSTKACCRRKDFRRKTRSFSTITPII